LFRKQTRTVFVTALPPVSPMLAEEMQIEAVATYSNLLRDLCAREACVFVDPFKDSREPDGSSARPDTMRDGVHLKSYRAVNARLGEMACPGGSF
jgi:hypothetical protein